MADLGEAFRDDMVEFGKLTNKVVGRAPTRVYQMMGGRGAVQTAIDLVMRPEASGFAGLLLTTSRRQDLSIEYLVLQKKYESLFPVETLQQAYDTLAKYRFYFPNGMTRP